MKAKIVSVLPPLIPDEKSAYDLVCVEVGLNRNIIVGIKKGTYRLGEELDDLPFQFLGQDGDAILMGMAAELYEHGVSETAEVWAEELEEQRMHPKNYRLKDGVEGIQAAYLQKIWHEMSVLGKFDVRKGFVYYFLNFPDDDDELWRIVGLGHLISEYRWRIEHEEAAIAEYKARENRRAGSEVAAKVRKKKGERTEAAVLERASVILEGNPSLISNNSQLAERVLLSIEEVREEFGWYEDVEVSKQWVRKLIRRFKDEGTLG